MEGDDPFTEIRKLIAEWDAAQHLQPNGERRNPPLDLLALAGMDFNYDWLVDGLWPVATQVHIFAEPKTGKSLLMLWVAANIALGRDPFTHQPIKRHRVSYIDNEMTIKDVRDRLMDMNMDFSELNGWLLYHPYPSLAPMDTVSGGVETLQLMQDDESDVLIIDTLSRVVKGEENSNDTYRNFYNHTGRLLKAENLSLARLDHAGHDKSKSRGASAKADDVDLVYGLEKRADSNGNPGYRLTRTHARPGGTRESLDLSLGDEPIMIKSLNAFTWTAQAIAKAKELAECNVPVDASQREAIGMLKAAGFGPGKLLYLSEAMRLRKSTERIDGFLGI
jgi:hypothetical protein